MCFYGIVYFKVCTIPDIPNERDLLAILRSPVVSVLVLALSRCKYLSCALLRVVSLPRSVTILFTLYYLASKVFSLQVTVVRLFGIEPNR